MFHRLQHKLTIIYSALFAAVFIVLAAAISWGVTERASETVREDMDATVAVFHRIWSLQESQLAESAGLLARDFGFRSAVATGDTPTVQSALDNLKGRLDVDVAFVLTASGEVVGLEPQALGGRTPALIDALSDRPEASGVGYFDDAAFQTVAVPVLAPDLIGWVVFARELSVDELARIADLAPISLTARLFFTGGADVWREPALRSGPIDAAQVFAGLDDVSAEASSARIRRTEAGRMISAAIPISPFMPQTGALLVLDFPLRAALAPYRSILLIMLATSLAGFGVLVAATWMVARGLTRPITALDEAAGRMAAGEPAQVADAGRDEIGRLGKSFNDMVHQILSREAHIRHAARHDQESGLPNRAALLELIASKPAEPGETIFVATIGIDRFHEIRNAIGYDLSARLLREVGGNLGRVGRVQLVARTATSALAAVYIAADRDEAARIARHLAHAASEPVSLDSDIVDVNVTIGIAADGDPSAPANLGPLELSGVALEQARSELGSLAFFDPARYGDPLATLSLMSSMIRALGTDDIYLAYQPKLDLRTGLVSGAEALLRWRHPDRGFIPPDVFVALAEETGHIIPLTDWVLGQAIADQARMRQAGHSLPVSVNLSGRLMCDSEFVGRVLERISAASADIVLEVTETAVINNPEKALAIMREVTSAGVALSIDDYGAGLSNLSYLKLIPAAELKIDKAFVLSLDSSRADALLVKSTIDLAHSLGMRVTAEGVESAAAMSMLASMGAEYAQGYHIARPQALDVLLGWLDEQARAPATPSRTRRKVSRT